MTFVGLLRPKDCVTQWEEKKTYKDNKEKDCREQKLCYEQQVERFVFNTSGTERRPND